MSAAFDLDVITELASAGIMCHRTDTGGGCTALQISVPMADGWYLLVTDDDASVPSVAGETIVIGLYEPEDTVAVDYEQVTDLADLVPAVQALQAQAVR